MIGISLFSLYTITIFESVTHFMKHPVSNKNNLSLLRCKVQYVWFTDVVLVYSALKLHDGTYCKLLDTLSCH